MLGLFCVKYAVANIILVALILFESTPLFGKSGDVINIAFVYAKLINDDDVN